ncbi:MAG: ketopantoate reductase family protein [Myxococcaceae bacterium]
MATRILIAGAGAVGQVFALYLQRGGAEIAFFVKPEHRRKPELPLFPQGEEATAVRTFSVLTTPEEAARTQWDQVWLTVPTNALGGDWLEHLLRATGQATVVVLSPEGSEAAPESRRVVGAIPFMAWQCPLPGETGPEGVAFWVPPLAPVPLSGDERRAQSVRDILKAGGMRSRRVKDASESGAPITALLMSFVATLERADWSFDAFRRNWTPEAARVAREAFSVSHVKGAWPLLARPALFKLIASTGPKLVPFDLENYTRYHFTKVGGQTRTLYRRWVEKGRAEGLPTVALEQTRAALESMPR